MYTYDLLETGCYYLVKEQENSPLGLIRVALSTDHCVFVQHFNEPMETAWKLKKDPLFDIIECLSDEAVKQWKANYLHNEDVFFDDNGDEE